MSSYTVTTLSDSGDDLYVSTDFAAETADGNGLSLREAIYIHNYNYTSYGINNPIINFSGALSGSILLSQQLNIGGYVEIRSTNGQGITLDAQGYGRALGIYGDVRLENISVTGGDLNSGDGGGIYVGSGALSLTNSAVFGNSAAFGNGGGIFANGDLTLTNVTVADNSASNGGGIYSSYSQASLVHSTVTSNSSTSNYSSYGGVVASTLNLTNSIILGNANSTGESNISASVNLYGYNVTAGYPGTTYANASTVFAQVQTVGYIYGGVLADNGGAVQTVALAYALPADTNYQTYTDARGALRGGYPDIGAFDLAQAETPSLIVDTDRDVVNAYDGMTSLREAIEHVRSGTLSGTISFQNGPGEYFEGPDPIIHLTSTLVIDGGMYAGSTPSIVIDSDPNGEGRPLIIISGDVAADDAMTTDSKGNAITDVVNNTRTTDNVEVFNLVGYADVTLNGLVITGGVGSLPQPPGYGGGYGYGGGGYGYGGGGYGYGGGGYGYGGGGYGYGGGGYGYGGGGYGYGGGGYGYGGGGYGYGGGGYGYGGGGYDPTANQRGGGITALADSSLTITNSSISGNASETFSGAITTHGGLLVLSDSLVESNDGNFGGGLNLIGTADLDRVTISNNTAVVGGGAVSSGYNDFTDVEIRDNVAFDPYGNGKGGAVYVTLGTYLTGERVTFADNSASELGGAVYSYGTLELTNATVAGNSAGTLGGGVYTKGFYGTTLNFSTITSNFAGTQGGATFTTGYATLSVSNSLILGNYAQSESELGGGNTSTTNSIVGGDASLIFAQTATSNGAVGGVLADNDGFVRTVALLNEGTNAAIDAGEDATTPDQDARGVDRDADYPDVANNGVNRSDLGAFEIGSIEVPSLIVTTAADILDPTDDETSLREAIGHINAGRLSGTITFASGAGEAFENGGLIRLTNGELEITSTAVIDGGPGVTITGDADANDALTTDSAENQITDVASNAANEADNARVLHVQSTDVTLRNLVITGGVADDGAGIRLSGTNPTLTLESSSVSGNHATSTASSAGGGGILVNTNTNATIRDSILSHNVSESNAGALRLGNNSSLIIETSEFSSNASGADGGAIRALDGSSLDITQATFANNAAATSGGAIDNSNGVTATIQNSTFTGNLAGGSGGALSGTSSVNFALTNSILSGNGDQSGNTSPASQVSEGITGLSGGNTLGDTVYAGAAATRTTDVGSIFAATRTIDPDGTPGNGDEFEAGALAAGQGAGATVALLEDALNPAIDAGSAVPGLATDATGATRDVDQALVDNGGTVDLGAVEVQTAISEAASLIVTIAGDVVDAFDNETSLREAIAHVNDGTLSGTISFANGAGEAFETGGEIDLLLGELTLSSDLTIDGDLDDDGAADVTVDAQGASRVVNVASGSSELIGLVITGGDAGAADGGGLNIASGATLRITNSEVTGNTTIGDGGGLSNSGTAVVTRSNFVNNSAMDGGGISSAGDLTVYIATISGNSATDTGGGVTIGQTGKLLMTNATVANNTAGNLGGGVYSDDGDFFILNSTISGNSATGSGQGVRAQGAGYHYSVEPASETKDTGIASVSNVNGSTLVNSVVTGNGGSTSTSVNAYGYTTQLSLISTRVGGDAATIFDAIDPGTGGGVLAENGGTGRTMSLLQLPVNTVIDGGSSLELSESRRNLDLNGDGDLLDTVGVDADGNGRDQGSAVDMGAVELGPEAPSLIVTTRFDTIDAFDGVTSLREAIAFANSDPDASTITFDAALSGNSFSMNAALDQLLITEDLTIDGDVDGDDRADVVLFNGNGDRLFAASGAGTDVTLKSLALDGAAGGDTTGSGAAIQAHQISSLTIEDSTFERFRASADGAAIDVRDDSSGSLGTTLSITGSTFHNNRSDGTGGAISLYNVSATLVNTTLDFNFGYDHGGGLYAYSNSSDTLDVINSTITDNQAAHQYGLTPPAVGGGGIAAFGVATTISNSVFTENQRSGGTGSTTLYDDVQTDSAITLNNSFLAVAVAGGTVTNNNSTNGAGGVLPSLGALVDNGGPVETRGILAGSPLIDAGDNSLVPLGLATDAAGGPRIVGAAVDIGAFELPPAPPIEGDGNDDLLNGTDNADSIIGNGGSDIVLAGDGPDDVDGGTGTDALAGQGGNDTLDGGSGDDLLSGGGGADLIYGGADNDTAVGGTENDLIFGGSGNDRLDGELGDDTLDGGPGDDTFVVDSADDVLIEDPGEGYDRVFASVSITLGDNVEAGNLTGSDDLSMTAATTGSWLNGNAGNNTLTGQQGSDRLDGNAGNDTLDGGLGNDILEGGADADVFVFSAGADVILDFEDGLDLIDLTGVGLLFSDLGIAQSGGNVLITHGLGTLTLLNFAAGDLSAADFLEPASSAPPVVTGTAGADILSESAGPLVLQGLGGNDLLRVLSGAATLEGGTGDDRYYVYETGTVITELAGEGTDRVYTRVDLMLADEVEIGATNGSGDIDITGNALANQISGNADANALSGLAGNDRLDGRGGTDTIYGGLGNDILEGGAGADRFVFETGDGTDLILDFEVGVDVIDYTATGLEFVDLTITDSGADALILQGTDVIRVSNMTAAELDETQFEFALLS
ncbi:MAG: calcium-binding protein [Pseudomonadota bacterium]